MHSIRSLAPTVASFSLVLWLVACAASPPAADNRQPQAAAAEKFGLVMPARFAAVALWPEQYAGQLTVLDVLPHGTAVKEGEVIAHLDTRSIDDELHREQLETRSSEIRHQGVLDRNRLEVDAAKSALDQATSALARARRSLDGYRTYERAFAKRSDDLQKKYEEANVEDQHDELDQLEKMYQADALVDATEDIVLKRSRRQLESTVLSNQLDRDRSKYTEEFDNQLTLAQREEAVQVQIESLARLGRQQELDARAREDAEARSADALREQQAKLERLRRDLALLTIKAPRAGILLHGAAKDYRPGRTPQRIERGGSLAFRAELLLVVDPEATAVAVDLTDADLARARDGGRARAVSLGTPSVSASGVLRIEVYPRSSTTTESTFEGTLVLEQPLGGVVHGTRVRVSFQDAQVASKTEGKP